MAFRGGHSSVHHLNGGAASVLERDEAHRRVRAWVSDRVPRRVRAIGSMTLVLLGL